MINMLISHTCPSLAKTLIFVQLPQSPHIIPCQLPHPPVPLSSNAWDVIMESLASSLQPAALLGRQLLLLGGLISTHYITAPQKPGKEFTSQAVAQRNAGHDWCRIRSNEYGQQQCRGCDEICSLMRWGEVQRRRDPKFEGQSQARMFHSNYRELDMCASLSGCDTCRIMRRAFLLGQVTGSGARSLEDPDQQWPVHAVLDLSDTGDSIVLTIESHHETLFTATVSLGQENCAPELDPTRAGARIKADFDELKRVVRDCQDNHDCSWKYRWSDQNPTWLLEILQNNHVRLVKGPASPVDYVVLSYSWGDPAAMPTTEWARIKGAATKTLNGIPILERLQPFSRWTLPETMQDAITITESLGFRYIWIDSVCIPKGTNWDTEASRMHEVYGNAAFTLAASSCTKATDRLLHDRTAWKHRNKACKLRGRWLQNENLPLSAVRLGSPAAQRGWTLQEERLSPRILYWAGQRWHWSCAERQVTELSDLGHTRPCTDNSGWSLPQQFLDVCRTGDEQRLNEEWLDIVEAYTRRDLAHAKDRFLAISGLAVRFYNAKVEGIEHCGTEEYLAGLWRDEIARHLAWSVEEAANPDNNLQQFAPSWSWASLPLKVHTNTKHLFKQSEHFRLVGTPGVSPLTAERKDRSQAVEERGRTVKVLEVQGRIRRFISEDSQMVRWEDIERRSGSRTCFNFSILPGCSVYARNPRDGRLVSMEAHRGEIVGQLDYLPIHEGDEKGLLGVCLPHGAEKELFCLELGDSAMLLLRQVPGSSESYRRVGVCLGYTNRRGFFYGCEIRNIMLC